MSRDDSVIDPAAATVAPSDAGAANPANAAATAPTAATAPERPAALATGAGRGSRSGQALDTTVTDPATARAPAVPPSDLVGSSLAHFQIEQLLGKGGMGEVYRATDLALDRQVAIKVLSRDIAEDPKLRRRFFREARAQARIHHPNVCHIYFIGEDRGYTFFAMEYIEGESLQERLDRTGAVPVGEAVEMCHLAALGLREANQHGFTHRDIKPSNLMVDRAGAVKVVDFGLVKEAAEEGSPKLSGAETTIEGTTIVGTPRYMPPEQARGEPVDFRSDIYSLGATLHHLVAGQPPFAGTTALAVVSQHLSQPRPHIESHRKWKRRGPAPLDVLCDRMMAKDPDQRFESYDDLIGAIENASPARTRPAGFWVRAFALALDAMVVVLLTLPADLLLPDPYDPVIFAGLALLYSVYCHGRWGRTLGKFALEIEVVAIDRHGPLGLRASALRFAVQWGLLYLLAGIAGVASLTDVGWIQPIATGTLFGVLFLVYPLEGIWSSWAVPGNRTFWDRAAGTRVRYRRLRE